MQKLKIKSDNIKNKTKKRFLLAKYVILFNQISLEEGLYLSQEKFSWDAKNRSNPALPELHLCRQKILANCPTSRHDQFPRCPAPSNK